MKLSHILNEGRDYTLKFGPKHKEIEVLNLNDKWDFGDRSNNVQTRDVVLRASSKDHSVYGRRPIKQRILKKQK